MVVESIVRPKSDVVGAGVVVLGTMSIGQVLNLGHRLRCSSRAIVEWARPEVQPVWCCLGLNFDSAVAAILLSLTYPAVVLVLWLPATPAELPVLNLSLRLHRYLLQARRMTGPPVGDRNSSIVRRNGGAGLCL